MYDGLQPTYLDHLRQKIGEAINYYNLHCKYYSEALYTSLNERFLSVVTKNGLKFYYYLFLEVHVRCLAVFCIVFATCMF